MERLTPLDESKLTEAEREVLEAITTGPRGNMGLVGPFGVFVRAPRVGNAAQALGAEVRFGTELSERLKEIAICVVGACYRARFEFAAHARLAERAGVDPAAVEAIRRGEDPGFRDEEAASVHSFSRQLVWTRHVDDATYTRARDALGERKLVELVLTIGYYTLVSCVLNAFDVPLPDDMTDPFPEG